MTRVGPTLEYHTPARFQGGSAQRRAGWACFLVAVLSAMVSAVSGFLALDCLMVDGGGHGQLAGLVAFYLGLFALGWLAAAVLYVLGGILIRMGSRGWVVVILTLCVLHAIVTIVVSIVLLRFSVLTILGAAPLLAALGYLFEKLVQAKWKSWER